MKKLIRNFTLLAIVLIAPNVMAEGSAFQDLREQYKAQQKQISDDFKRLDKATQETGMWGVPATAGSNVVTPRSGQRRQE